jgi:hypothetical protein
MGLAPIDRLGGEIETRWRRVEHDPRAFPDICAEQLAAARIHEALEPREIVRWALASGDLPPQADPAASFGQPPVTLFRSRLFYIDALFWVDGTTAIHDHGFSGAFQVLAGSSIETRFEFQPTRDVDRRLLFGSLRAVDVALLGRGAVRPIVAGPGMIHSLFHLERPSVSLVARSYWDPTPGLQFEYFPPGIAIESFTKDEVRDRLLQIVKLLRVTDDPGFEREAGDLVARADLATAFAVLRSCAALPDRQALERLVDRVADDHASSSFRDALAALARLDYLRSRRALVRDADLRFFLAVLLNAHRRADVLRLAASYRPDRAPERQIAAWLGGLSRLTMRLQVGGAAWEPNALGLPELTPALEDALADELAGRARAPAAPDVHADGEVGVVLDRLRALPYLAVLFEP